MKVLESKKTTVVLSIIIIALLPFCLETFVYNFECLAGYLYGTGVDNKGKLLTVILTTIGGLGALWGLCLNNQRLKQQIRQVNEQVRQNNIAIQNSNDKRFGEAIGYLNDDNEGIAIGGVYALYQLAKEDERYAPIITNIFCNYVNDNTDKQDKKSYQTILSLLFSKDNPFVFDKQPKFCNINFSHITLFCYANDLNFFKCNFEVVNLIGKNGVAISECNIKDIVFIDFSNVRIYAGHIEKLVIISNYKMNIYLGATKLSNIEIIVNNSLHTLLVGATMIDDVRVYTNSIYWLGVDNFIQEFSYSKLSIHYVSKISEKHIDSKISGSNAIKFIKDDAVKSDKFYRQRAGLLD